MLTSEQLNGGFDLGDWEVLPAQGLLRRDGVEEHPEPMVLKVLLTLAQRNGDLVTKDELIEEVWQGRAFSDEPVLRCISLLRGHLGDSKPYSYVETLHRRGYRLLQPVELHRDGRSDAPGGEEGRSLRLWRATAAIIGLALVAVTAWQWLGEEPPAVRSLAIMPVDNLSGNPANQYVADGIKNTLAQRLGELPEFTIKNVRNVYEGESTKVAAALGVESILYGTTQVQNGVLRIGYEIVRGSDGVSMLTGEETGSLDNLFALQERLANAVRDRLAGSRTPELITRTAPDSAAYNHYMRGMYALEHRFEKANLEASIDLFQESIRRDESYGPAYLGLATAYALLPDYRGAAWQEHLDLALQTINRGVAMDASIADPAAAIFGFVHYQKKEWSMAEDDYRRAVGADIVDSNAFSWYSQMLAGVARLDEALDMALAGEVIDPDSPVVNSRIAMVYTWLDETDKAGDYFERANDLDATGIIHEVAYALFLVRSGKVGQARSVARDAIETEGVSAEWIDPVFRAFEDPTYAASGLAAINRAWAEGQVIPHIVLLARAMLGDIDGAMEVAWLATEPGETFSTEILFIRELAPLRQHAQFLPLIEELGIVDYWRIAGCRWENDRVDCGS